MNGTGPSGRASRARTVAVVLAVYAVVALLLVPLLDGLQRLLVLPQLFGRLARIALGLGAPLVGLAAWRHADDRQA